MLQVAGEPRVTQAGDGRLLPGLPALLWIKAELGSGTTMGGSWPCSSEERISSKASSSFEPRKAAFISPRQLSNVQMLPGQEGLSRWPGGKWAQWSFTASLQLSLGPEEGCFLLLPHGWRGSRVQTPLQPPAAPPEMGSWREGGGSANAASNAMNKSFGQPGIRQADVDRARGVEGQRQEHRQTDGHQKGGSAGCGPPRCPHA